MRKWLIVLLVGLAFGLIYAQDEAVGGEWIALCSRA